VPRPAARVDATPAARAYLPAVLSLSCRRLPLVLLVLGLSAFAAEPSPQLLLQPAQARPGDPVLITVRGPKEAPTGTLGERPLRFFAVPGGHAALIGLPVEQVPGQLPLTVMVAGAPGAEPTRLTRTVDVVEPGWRTRTLKVANKFVKPPPEVEARLEADQAAFSTAFAQPFAEPLFDKAFVLPRKARVTAPYGDLRTFNGQKQSQHFGTDLSGGTGTPVSAANGGTVVMTRENYAAGNTVLLHHGAGLYTAYFHLSAIAVKEGERVKRGQLLGKVGNTGRVTGPHLHWGARVDDLWVDPATLLQLQFTASDRSTSGGVSRETR
jgi:murein DD-endopeptidase MepM/ murein hydrolase activator NlpD